MRVAIVGAGVAGSFLAYLLTQKQIPAVVFERRSAREKPCGGGCTAKVSQRYPLVASAALRHNRIRTIHYESSGAKRFPVPLAESIAIYSRRELDGFLLDQALRSGARLVRARAVDFGRRDGAGWWIRAESGELEEVDVLVGADGAASLTRKRFGIRFDACDLSVTLGYYVPGTFHPEELDIRFLDPELLGYLWSFPRVDHLSLGIISLYRQLPSPALRARLDSFARDRYGIEDPSAFPGYAAPVPTLSAQMLESLKVNGPDWALVGDAAGFADPITAEGIYYALRSADLLSQAVSEGDLAGYHERWREDFGRDLLEAARLKNRFYRKSLLRDTFINRMLQFTRRSPAVQRAHNDFIAGRENYLTLKGRLLRELPAVLLESLRRPRYRSMQ